MSQRTACKRGMWEVRPIATSCVPRLHGAWFSTLSHSLETAIESNTELKALTQPRRQLGVRLRNLSEPRPRGADNARLLNIRWEFRTIPIETRPPAAADSSPAAQLLRWLAHSAGASLEDRARQPHAHTKLGFPPAHPKCVHVRIFFPTRYSLP